MISLILNLVVLFESEGSSLALLLAGPGAGIGFYSWIYLYYRNSNKRYMFEADTAITTKNWRRIDRKVGVNNGTKRKRVKGDNSTSHLTRVRRV